MAAPNVAAPSKRRKPLSATNIVHTLCTSARKRLDHPIHLNRETLCAASVSGAPVGASRDSSIALLLAQSAAEISLPVPIAVRNPGKPAEFHSGIISRRLAVPSFPASRLAIFAPRPVESSPLPAGKPHVFSDPAPWCARFSSSERFPPPNICLARLHAPRSACRSLRSTKKPGSSPDQTPPHRPLQRSWAWRSLFRNRRPPRPSFHCRKQRTAGAISYPSQAPTAPCTEPAASDAAPSSS